MHLNLRKSSGVALVIGNSDYSSVAHLPNAANDAKLIGSCLREIGYEVRCHLNLDREGMDRAFEEFLMRLNADRGTAHPTATAIFYYSGHGYQDQGINYLLPCGKGDLSNAVSLQDWISQLSELSRRRLVFLDACRSYFDVEPVQSAIARSRGLSSEQLGKVRGGLADIEAADDTFISFSAAPGKPAYDGVDGRENSPYAEALARFIHEVDLPLHVLTVRVRNSVKSDTEHFRTDDGKPAYQRTWDSSSLKAGFFFNPSSLLFLLGNALALLASLVALASFSVVFYESSVVEYTSGETRWHWPILALAVLFLSLGIFFVWRGSGIFPGSRRRTRVATRRYLPTPRLVDSRIFGSVRGYARRHHRFGERCCALLVRLAWGHCRQLGPSFPMHRILLGRQQLAGGLPASWSASDRRIACRHLYPETSGLLHDAFHRMGDTRLAIRFL
jgi:hypothetical protein